MEKPDANGFITVNWPSKNIPHGGIFHSRQVEPSSARKEFLKVLLEESKLTIAQRRKSALALREEENRPRRQPHLCVPVVRPRTSRRRSLSAIRESGILEIDDYRPVKRGEDRERLKERLASMMAYGDTPEQTPPPPPRIAKPAPKLPSAKEQWNELLTQIRERAEWLAEMEYLGEAGPHREIIKDQIAERMRALDALGIDSECSTARSAASGFSTTRSKEMIQKTVRSTASSTKSVRSNKSQGKPKCEKYSGKKTKDEENVAAYGQLSPLQYSPRRRV